MALEEYQFGIGNDDQWGIGNDDQWISITLVVIVLNIIATFMSNTDTLYFTTDTNSDYFMTDKQQDYFITEIQ